MKAVLAGTLGIAIPALVSLVTYAISTRDKVLANEEQEVRERIEAAFDLAPLRDSAALEHLPGVERGSWQAFWVAVHQLAQRLE